MSTVELRMLVGGLAIYLDSQWANFLLVGLMNFLGPGF